MIVQKRGSESLMGKVRDQVSEDIRVSSDGVLETLHYIGIARG